MINGKSILAIIPARGGSKGVHRKNIRVVAGKPLIAWTIEEAKKSKYIDRLITSSEDGDIIKVAQKWGCEVPFIRPLELAQDDTPSIDTVLHTVEMVPHYNYIVLLQPTSPLRTAKDIDGCIECCIKSNGNAAVSVTEPDKNPYWMYKLGNSNFLRPLIKGREHITRRQDLPKIYALNGAVYIAKMSWLLKTKSFISSETLAYKMDKTNSIDIDSELDLKICDLLLSEQHKI